MSIFKNPFRRAGRGGKGQRIFLKNGKRNTLRLPKKSKRRFF